MKNLIVDWENDRQHHAISPIEEIIEEARAGRMFILVDHEDRENEGDLIIPAKMAKSQAINFMVTHGRGLICLALTEERVDQLGLELMSSKNSSQYETAFTTSIEAKEGVTTGISTADRAQTIKVAIDKKRGKSDLVTPGHIFPLRAKAGGVLVRAGHTEAAVDISRIAGLNPSGVICEIMNDDGTMSRLPELVTFALKHGLKIGSIGDLIKYRRRHDNLVEPGEKKVVSVEFGGDWIMQVFTDTIHNHEHIALIKGDISEGRTVPIRMHVMNPLLDAIGIKGKCRSAKLDRAMQIIGNEGCGVVVLLRDTASKITENLEPSHQVLKQYGIGAQILSSLGLSKLQLITNSPKPNVIGLEAYGLEIVGTRRV